jgi:ankyrin repeat protein
MSYNDGSTALIWASGSGARDSVALLLAHGAEVNLRERMQFVPDCPAAPGGDALDSAEDREIGRMLRAAGARRTDWNPMARPSPAYLCRH